MKFPTDNDAGGEPSKDELAELQRMVSENEKALTRARKMITDLKQQLKPKAAVGKRPATKARKKS